MNLTIGTNIKNLHVKRGITQEQLAVKIGVTPQSVSKWERNECYPDITYLIPIAEYFAVTIDELMGMNEEKKEKLIKGKLNEIEKFRHIGYQDKKLFDQRDVRRISIRFQNCGTLY